MLTRPMVKDWLAGRTIGGVLTVLDRDRESIAGLKGLEASNRSDLTAIATGFRVRRLNLSGCVNLAQLPGGMEVRHLNVAGCTSLAELPAGLHCYEVGAQGSGLRAIPADLRVDFRLDLTNCTGLVDLPDGLKVGSLRLRGCTGLHRLPEGIEASFLDLRGCSRLEIWPDSARIRIGRLDLGGCRRLPAFPAGIGRLAQLDISDCTGLKELPAGLEVGSWIELANTGLTGLPDSLAGVNLRWRGVPVDRRVAFDPGSIGVDEVLREENAGRRRVLLERVGIDRFIAEAEPETLDEDRDPGGPRRLLRVPMGDDEALVCVMVHCPSTGGRYLLRVPPAMRTCRQAVAWTAGFDDPALYQPLVEA